MRVQKLARCESERSGWKLAVECATSSMVVSLMSSNPRNTLTEGSNCANIEITLGHVIGSTTGSNGGDATELVNYKLMLDFDRPAAGNQWFEAMKSESRQTGQHDREWEAAKIYDTFLTEETALGEINRMKGLLPEGTKIRTEGIFVTNMLRPLESVWPDASEDDRLEIAAKWIKAMRVYFPEGDVQRLSSYVAKQSLRAVHLGELLGPSMREAGLQMKWATDEQLRREPGGFDGSAARVAKLMGALQGLLERQAK